MDLRCPSRIQGIITDTGLLEIKCSAKHCGAVSGIVVLHYFDLATGEMVDTKKYNNPTHLLEKSK
jgi:hypothetical protein